MFAFDRLVQSPRALAHHRNGPLADERSRFLAHLADHGFSCSSLQHFAPYLLVIADRLRLADRPGEIISHDEIKRETARWARRTPVRLGDRRDSPYSRWAFFSIATRWLTFLGRLGQPSICPGLHAAQLNAYADSLLHEKGLLPDTINSRCRFIQRFLNRLGASAGSLTDITICRIDETLIAMINQCSYARVTVRSLASMLRSFFRYAETRGWCRQGLAYAIKAPHVFTQASLPAGPSWNDVRRLLATTEGNEPADIRDRAILMLLAIYGLRAHEVRLLQLENIDWKRELLSVPSRKGKHIRTYPLVRPVGEAILRYLKEVRPRSTYREIFMSLFPPVRPLGHMWAIVGKRLRSLNISLPHIGPHALRHACATHLLAQGLSLKEIGDHLGHQSLDSTRIYAKVDIVGLRQVADFDFGGLV